MKARKDPNTLSSLIQTLSEGDNIGYVPGQETAGLVVLYPRPVTPSTTYSLIGPLERTRNTQVPGSIAPVTEQRTRATQTHLLSYIRFRVHSPRGTRSPALSLDAGIQIFLTTLKHHGFYFYLPMDQICHRHCGVHSVPV